MNLSDRLLMNARKPKGFLGSVMIKKMNIGHLKMTLWALEKLKIKNGATILDVGCGGGKAIHLMSQVAHNGRVFGIDYSEKSVQLAARENAENIKHGKVKISKASVSSLPFPDASFDNVTSFESYYFWPDLKNDMREILRVLKPGGLLMIVAEMYKNENFDEHNKYYVKKLNMNYMSKDEFIRLFESAGYVNTGTYEDVEKGWICVIGAKPQAESNT